MEPTSPAKYFSIDPQPGMHQASERDSLGQANDVATVNPRLMTIPRLLRPGTRSIVQDAIQTDARQVTGKLVARHEMARVPTKLALMDSLVCILTTVPGENTCLSCA